jgi:serine/threonine-protein kinase
MVIHRDIKPENILLSGGHALIADFGIARALAEGDERDDRLTETGVTLGAPHYMSPEQASGERTLDARTDVCSLGCVVYEMLAGEPPFTGPNQQAILFRRLTGPVPHPSAVRDIPPAVDVAVTRALARAPADRFATSANFAAALEPATGSESAPREAPRSTLRGRPARAIALGAGSAAVLLAGYHIIQPDTAGRSAPPASAAVLPFVDLSPDKDQEYFSDGLTRPPSAPSWPMKLASARRTLVQVSV